MRPPHRRLATSAALLALATSLVTGCGAAAEAVKDRPETVAASTAVTPATAPTSAATPVSTAAGAAETPAPSATGSAVPIPAGVTVIEGTSWAGTDSDGDAYVYTFNPGGRYAYQSPNGSFGGDDDTWAQTGDQLVMKTSGGYATYIGTVGDGVISGTASNIQGRTWTWTAKQQ